MFRKIANRYREVCQKVGAATQSPNKGQAQLFLFALGIVVVSFGLIDGAEARNIKYNDQRVAESVNGVLTYLEGTVGALVMVACGIGAIMSSAFGQYRAALGLMVVAVGAFILRSLMSTFFNDVTVMT
jgi:hypothetical protein